MKHLKLLSITIALFFCITGFSQTAQKAQDIANTLTGKVSDSTNKNTLPGAVLYIPDLKVAAQTGSDGTYTIDNLPKGTFIVEVHIIGYKVLSVPVKIEGATSYNFSLVSSVFQENEVVVTANSKAVEEQHDPQSTTDVSTEYLNEHSSTNVIEAIGDVPGVAAMTDGQSIAKPMIRGLGYNRVLSVTDGVELVDQPWFDEFGIEIDPDAVSSYQILKGPGSLAYGSDAIAGVINYLPEAPLPAGQFKGDVMFNYQTNNGLIGNMVHLAGTSLSGISWSARLDNTMAHAYQDAYDGYALNTQFNTLNTDQTVGIHRKWGYSQLHFSYFDEHTGIVDGTRDSVNGVMERNVSYPNLDGNNPLNYEDATYSEETSYTPFVIYQRIQDYNLVWDNSIALGSGSIKATFSYQKNVRQETNNPDQPNLPDIFYYSNGLTYDLRYVGAPIGDFNYSVGGNGVYQNSQSLGTIQLIPNYNYIEGGAFAIASQKVGNLNLSGGLRYDMRTFTGDSRWIDTLPNNPQAPEPAGTYGAYPEFNQFTSNFSGASGSFGATYDFTRSVYMKANIAQGWRAPNVEECGADGVHDGTVVYEIGDNTIKPETNVEEDITFGVNSKDVSFEADVFNNYINNFIYSRGLRSKSDPGEDSVSNLLSVGGTLFPDAPVFKYTNGTAQMYGGEMSLDVHPSGLKWLELNATVSIVDGGLLNVPDTMKYLPFVPPMKTTGDIIIHLGKIGQYIDNAYVRVGVINVAQQNDIYTQSSTFMGLNTPETQAEYQASLEATAGYTLFNAGLGGHILKHGHEFCELYIICNNIMNTTYMDYMSRFKYYPADFAVNPPRVGVFNMGRNVSIKMIIPFDFKN